MRTIRNEAVILGECDSFESVCTHLDELYAILRAQREAILMLAQLVEAKKRTRPKTPKKKETAKKKRK